MTPKTLLTTALLLVTASCVHTVPIDSNVVPVFPYYQCGPDATIPDATLRMAVAGWGIAQHTDTFVQTDWRVVSSKEAQTDAIMRRSGVERESMRITAVATVDGPLFRLDLLTDMLVSGVPHIQYEVTLADMDPSDMDPQTFQMFLAIRWAVCGGGTTIAPATGNANL